MKRKKTVVQSRTRWKSISRRSERSRREKPRFLWAVQAHSIAAEWAEKNAVKSLKRVRWWCRRDTLQREKMFDSIAKILNVISLHCDFFMNGRSFFLRLCIGLRADADVRRIFQAKQQGERTLVAQNENDILRLCDNANICTRWNLFYTEKQRKIYTQNVKRRGKKIKNSCRSIFLTHGLSLSLSFPHIAWCFFPQLCAVYISFLIKKKNARPEPEKQTAREYKQCGWNREEKWKKIKKNFQEHSWQVITS